ncbi:MAG: NifU family protein [Thermodesulfobacteriota bacterium]
MEPSVKVDLREMPVFKRHPHVFDTWDELATGAVMRLTNDYAPNILKAHFESLYHEIFQWKDVESQPGTWVVDIKRLRCAEPDVGEDVEERVLSALADIRPMLESDGGDVELVEIDREERVVRVRLTGACSSCPSSAQTLKGGVEKAIKDHAPEIRTVENVKDVH